jgi:hypothetical protein
MRRRSLPPLSVVLGVALAWGLAFGAGAVVAVAAEGQAGKAPPKTRQAWTLDEATAQLRLAPEDVYLQYVVLQLARGEGKLDEVAGAVESLRGRQPWEPPREVDLFDLFTGALAVQEALQLDAMRGDRPAAGPGGAEPPQGDVKVASLEGPRIKSHPWGEMLAAQSIAGKRPEVSPLARYVPADQYYVVARSLSKLLEVSDAGDLWGAHLFNQAARSAKTHRTGERLKRQLAVRTDPLTRPFYDMVVDEVALTGGDLYLREGSDVTVLFRLKQPVVFRLRMDAFLLEAEKSRPDAVRSTGRIGEVEYVQVATPDREIHVFSAYPKPDLHVRGNSKAGLERVLSAIGGGEGVERLGETAEFRYIRTLFVRGDAREDVLVYLSDPFIRRLVGPEVKLTERRRMICYNHLRMIGHAAMLYRTQYGRAPRSLDELAAHGCAPGVFGEHKLRCPDGGKYVLSADGATGVCSVHGHADRLVPCREIPVETVTRDEAREYSEFVGRYSQYWQQFFDPIAIRLQVTPEQYRAETVILPLLDNSIYTGMAAALGGEPEPLDALPVPNRNIFSVAVRLNKEALLKNGTDVSNIVRGAQGGLGIRVPGEQTVREFLVKGLGNQVGFHVCDASPMFDLNLTGFLGDMVREFGIRRMNDDMLGITFLVASLNSPVYISVPVRDRQVVDRFLDELDATLSELARKPPERGWFEVDYDFYRLPLGGEEADARSFCLQVGPIRWRLFYARVGDGLYVASKPYILEDIAKMAGEKQDDAGPTAHAMVRVRPKHWKDVLTTFRLGWAESSRQACLDNLAPISSIARAMRASTEGELKAEAVCRAADEVHAVHFFCPDGGKYELSSDGTAVACSVHGSAGFARQGAAPAAGSPIDRLMKDFAGATAELTFLEDGLHAVVTIRRK